MIYLFAGERVNENHIDSLCKCFLLTMCGVLSSTVVLVSKIGLNFQKTIFFFFFFFFWGGGGSVLNDTDYHSFTSLIDFFSSVF